MKLRALFTTIAIGLTIAPGFSCTRTEPDGTKTEVMFEE